jgi:hypothetical protein
MRHASPLVTSFAIITALAGCGGGGSERLSAPPAITITAPESVAIGERVVLLARAEDRDGGMIRTRTWEQIDGPELQLSGFEDETIEFSAPRIARSAEVTLEHCVVDDEMDTACVEVSIVILSAVDLGLRGGIQSVLDITDSRTGLPLDEASLQELRNGRFNSTDWWPQHVAMQMMALIIGHALTIEDPEIFASLELDDDGLLERFDDLLESLEEIADNRSRHFPARDFLAFYHIYQGLVPQSDSLGRFVSFEDNALLYTGLTLAANYLADIDEETTERLLSLRGLLDLSLWKSPDGTISRGTTELPVAEEKFDRFLTEARLSIVAAHASGALSRSEFEAVLDDLLDQSLAAEDVQPGVDIPVLPPLGEMREVYAAIPWLGEGTTALMDAVLIPLYAAHDYSAGRLGVPISHTAVPVIQRRIVEYALSPLEGVDELLEEFQDLPVIVPPGAAMLTAVRTDASLTNYEESVLILVNEEELDFDATYGPPAVFDFGVTATVPEGTSPMYGTLQTGYAIAALATNRLDRDFIVDLLRRDLGWDEAVRNYRNWLLDTFGGP